MSRVVNLFGWLTLASSSYTIFLYLIVFFPTKLQKFISSCSSYFSYYFMTQKAIFIKSPTWRLLERSLSNHFPPSSLSFIAHIRLKIPVISLFCSFHWHPFNSNLPVIHFPGPFETFDSNFSISGVISLSYMSLCCLCFLKHQLMAKLPWTSWIMDKAYLIEAINAPPPWCNALW